MANKDVLDELQEKAAKLVESKETKTLTTEMLDEMSQEEFDALVESIDSLDELSKDTLKDYMWQVGSEHNMDWDNLPEKRKRGMTKASRKVDDKHDPTRIRNSNPVHLRDAQSRYDLELDNVKQKVRSGELDSFSDHPGYQKAKADLKRAEKTSRAQWLKGLSEADFATLFDGESLSEEFKIKATALFEAAVAARTQEIAATLEEEFNAAVEEMNQKMLAESTDSVEGLADKVDGYLDYMIEQWMKDNELALDRGIKTELFESFMTGMRTLFDSHNINVPEGELNVLDELRESKEELEQSMDEMLAENVMLKQQLREIEKAEMIREACEGLTNLDADRFIELAESLSFDNEEVYAKKLVAIRENFFNDEAGTQPKQLVESVEDNLILNEDEQVLDPSIRTYVSTLSRLSTK